MIYSVIFYPAEFYFFMYAPEIFREPFQTIVRKMNQYQESPENEEEEESKEAEESEKAEDAEKPEESEKAEETVKAEDAEKAEETVKAEVTETSSEGPQETEEALNVMKISDLAPFERKLQVTFCVVEKGESRTIVSKKTNEEHNLADLKVGDETGTITLTLWDETIDRVTEGSTFVLKNGYVNVFQSQMRLALGKWGSIEDTEDVISSDDVKTENDRSLEQHEDRRRRRPYDRGGGSQGQSSYGGGRSSRGRDNSGYRGRSDRQESQDRW